MINFISARFVTVLSPFPNLYPRDYADEVDQGHFFNKDTGISIKII